MRQCSPGWLHRDLAPPKPDGQKRDDDHDGNGQPFEQPVHLFVGRQAVIARDDHFDVTGHDCALQFFGLPEHGIGAMKRDLLPTIKDPVAMELMRALKRTLDPNGILNPGKVL